jgi:hypothetical protein
MFIEESSPLGWIGNAKFNFFNDGAIIMAKGQDAKKAVKKEPAKTTKEKKADKKVKQEEKKRQGP